MVVRNSDISKMSAKLIVHKFENGISSKSLLITIAEGDDGKSESKFGEWTEGTASGKKKENEKSSRLVVKIVTGSESTLINLDTCAKYIDNFEMKALHLYNYTHSLIPKDGGFNTETYSTGMNYANKDTGYYRSCAPSDNERRFLDQYYTSDKEINLNTLCPLEYSLERVKENNARIMENIHMLNRTLNYTKKKEILDISCPKSIRSYPCETCGKCFVYETGLKRHYTMRHAITEAPPRWQVVWTCVECFQVWPQQDLAYNHSKQCSTIDSVDNVREIKTSSLLQCEFCEKVFTSIPRLVWHSKKHSTLKNYECNTCETSFTSFRVAEEHWLSCPWLKAYYNFSLPKLLLCNSCDRKFRNYEQLYNHRYKIGHFMAKSTNISLDTFAYQCEICAICFSSIPLLQVHKQQCHPIHDVSSGMVGTNNYNDFNGNYFATNNETL